jgi:bifunctional non-homologous end joining protein LigD
MSQVVTSIDGVNVKLTNLEKVLFPLDGISKAELIQYYLSVYEYMAPLIGNRPLTLIRFPEGIEGTKFYSKNAPDFTPDWVPISQVSDIKYVNIQKSADLIYLANLASLEMHAMNLTTINPGMPDTMIFDLDPSESVDFQMIKATCIELCELIKNLGYHPHVKTSGSKGLHIYVPVIPQYSIENVFNTAKSIGLAYTDINKNTTLKISKEKRVGKILIDIYRNHQSQTCVAPLSTRARNGAPVSMPLLFDDLINLKASNQYTIKNALDYLKSNQPWKDYNILQSKLHDHENIASEPIKSTVIADLSTYEQKRDFTKTSEPKPIVSDLPKGNRYTIQMHDATNLHYDLRLEENGVLSSWAIPKSLPTLQGIKRLAIRTEDHPLMYLDFEGVIPKGEYGGGTMWLYDQGVFEIVKKEKESYRIILKNGTIEGEFSLYHTKENQWIIELKSGDKNLSIPGIMLAEQAQNVPPAKDYFFELKWDGIRVSVIKEGPKIKILSKSNRDITAQFPEVAERLNDIDAEVVVMDGELVCLDAKGAPVFANIISRMHTKSKNLTDLATKSNPAVLYLFDLKHLDGKNCMNLPIERRREWLTLITKKSKTVRISEAFDDGEALFNGAKALGLEGIMAKKKGSRYSEKRSTDWLKIKSRTIIDTIIIGYTKGKGDRSALLGAIHVAKNENGKLTYLGKVGTGFDEAKLIEISNMLKVLPVISKPIPDVIEEEYNTIWIENGPECEVQYASITPNGTLREPVFYRWKIEE